MKKMETPTNERLRPRLSSSLKKSRKSLTLDSSASKLVKNLKQKEKLRKINQYKTAKSKRADLLVKKRHIQDGDIDEDNEYKEKIEVDEHEKENHADTTENFSMIENETFPIKFDPLVEQQQVTDQNIQGGISSKISSSIMKRINNFKSSIKNIVSTSSKTLQLKQNNNQIKLPVKQEIMENVQTFSNPKNKVRRSISMNNFPTTYSKTSSIGVKTLSKQDSTSSVQFNHPITSSTLLCSKNSAFASSSSLSFRSHNSSSNLPCRPVFKVSTKIQYNDSQLYRNEAQNIDTYRLQKIVTTRKIARTHSTNFGKGNC